MKRKFCCDASRDSYERYYLDQSGSGMPFYQGSRGQRGHGLGSMLSGLFRSAFPMIKRGLATFGKQALRTGLEIANDVADGNSFSDSAKARIPSGIKRFASGDIFSNQTGSGKRRRLTRIKKLLSKKKKAKSRDLFT